MKKSKSSALSVISAITVLSAIGFISVYISHGDKQVFISQLIDPAPDLSVERLHILIDDYHGFLFMFDFWFVSEFFMLYLTVLFIWAGVFLSPDLQRQKESGLGNLLVTRMKYEEYLRNLMIAQLRQITVVIASSSAIILAAALIVGGADFTTVSINGYSLNLAEAITVMLLQILLTVAVTFVINTISMLSNIWIRNRYIIQSMNLVFFTVAPSFIASLILPFSWKIGEFLLAFAPVEQLTAIRSIFRRNFDLAESIYVLIPTFTYCLIMAAMYKLNTKKFSRDYL